MGSGVVIFAIWSDPPQPAAARKASASARGAVEKEEESWRRVTQRGYSEVFPNACRGAMFSMREAPAAMKNPDPNADGTDGTSPVEAEAEDPQAQQIDLDDVDISAEPVASKLPPGQPPLPPMPQAPPGAPPASFAPVAPPASIAPPAPSRGPMFYVAVLVGVLVVSGAVGTVVALSRRRGPNATSATTTASASAAPKVITIGTVEMDDNPDSGP
jgi:hypothetical protein